MIDSGVLYTGRTMGRCELLVPLAEGATAQVWAARTDVDGEDRIVAVKVMLAELADDLEAESMFLDEARLVSRIRHPNVASVLSSGEEGDVLYIVMEWVEGEPLQVVLREVVKSGGRRVPLPLAVRIVSMAAAGLHAAHQLCDEEGKPVGLVHRDVSPSNLLVGYDGAVKVIDFGVAKATSNMQRTSVGQLKGKVPYMAPEQVLGEKVDARTDVFALGVVLYQLVTGKHPFRGDDDFSTMVRIRDKNPAAAPRTLVPDLPPALEEVMLEALAKNRDERYASMLDFGRALATAMPPAPDVDRALGSFMRTLVAHRAAKREAAIRDALRAVSERTGRDGGDPQTPGTDARPVNLGARPVFEDPERSSGIRPVSALVDLDAVPNTPAPPGATSAPAPAAASRSVDASDLPEGMRPRNDKTRLVAVVVMALVLLLGLVLAVTSSSGSGEATPTRRAF